MTVGVAPSERSEIHVGLVALLGAMTLLGLLDRWTPYLVLATFYRLHYAVLLGVAAPVANLLCDYPVALAALLLVGVNLLVISQVAPAPEAAAAGSEQLRVLIVNVEYGNREYDRVARAMESLLPIDAWDPTSAPITSR